MRETPSSFGDHLLDAIKEELSRIKVRAEKAIGQVRNDRALHAKLDEESNSIAVLVMHLSGNMLSRWTDFLTADGEKPTRNRDGEFEPADTMSRADLVAAWEAGWACLFNALDGLAPADLEATVQIRGESFTALDAILRQLSHYASQIGQIVLLAKHLEWERWQSLSIPRRRPQRS